MGTTKLTRKEILAEDPVHEAMLQMIEFTKVHGKRTALVVAAALVVALGIYAGLQYLDNRETQAQEQLGKAIEFFHGQVAADATDDPYGKGATPTFRSHKAKYEAAAREFASLASGYGYSKLAVLARYYLGLCQKELGDPKGAIASLEPVASNSKDRMVGYLAKKVLAGVYVTTGNYKAADELLRGMIKDPQCILPKEDMSLQLSRSLVAEGKKDEAMKVLREAVAQGQVFTSGKQQLSQELDRLQKQHP